MTLTLCQALKKVAKDYPLAMVQGNAHEPEYPADIVAEIDDDNGRDYTVHDDAIYELDDRGYVNYVPVYTILHPTIFTAEQLIDVIKSDQDEDADDQATRLALEDGAYLRRLIAEHGPISQALVEEAHAKVTSRSIAR